MKNFEYAQPRTVAEAVSLLAEKKKTTAVLAGGTDLVGLMKRMVITPDRVVNVCEIRSLQHIETDDDGNLWIGAAVRLGDLLDDPAAESLPSIRQVIDGISSIQLRSQGTLVGELLRRPTCWYFRNGCGLLADAGRMVVAGDNRYHAILGNRGPAKFVSASRLAPALIALGAAVRIVGPGDDDDQIRSVAELYRTPRTDSEQERTLQPDQLVTHVVIPPTRGQSAATYEVRHGEGPDQPLAAASVSLRLSAGRVDSAAIVLGQVAPTPWLAADAAQALRGQRIDHRSAELAGIEAVAGATPLSHNAYKIQLAQVAVKRALLRAAGLETGGIEEAFEDPSTPLEQDQSAMV